MSSNSSKAIAELRCFSGAAQFCVATTLPLLEMRLGSSYLSQLRVINRRGAGGDGPTEKVRLAGSWKRARARPLRPRDGVSCRCSCMASILGITAAPWGLNIGT